MLLGGYFGVIAGLVLPVVLCLFFYKHWRVFNNPPIKHIYDRRGLYAGKIKGVTGMTVTAVMIIGWMIVFRPFFF